MIFNLCLERCHELRCPDVALAVFGDYAKHNLPLTLPAARWLLHSVYVDHPIEKVLITASLYPIYGLPQISEDLPSAAMVAAACVKHQSRLQAQAQAAAAEGQEVTLTEAQKKEANRAQEVVDGLLPQIKKMLEEKGPQGLEVVGSLEEAKMNKWISWALKRVNKAVKREKGDGFVDEKLIPLKIRVQASDAGASVNAEA